MPHGGCHESEPVEWVAGFIDTTCPVVHQLEVNEVFRSWNWLHDSSLPEQMRTPVGGGWSDQSPVWIEMMELLREVQIECLKS